MRVGLGGTGGPRGPHSPLLLTGSAEERLATVMELLEGEAGDGGEGDWLLVQAAAALKLGQDLLRRRRELKGLAKVEV